MRTKLSAREAIARSYPTWDRDTADRLIAWLDHCGYTIVKKSQDVAAASLVPTLEEAAIDIPVFPSGKD
jgi:hypothetical protein